MGDLWASNTLTNRRIWMSYQHRPSTQYGPRDSMTCAEIAGFSR